MITTDMQTNSYVANRHGIARPFYFKSDDNQLFAWLHRPVAPLASKLGVVICAPYGYESICAHRSIREFAEAITAAGIPAMRFDYSGTGDSAEIDKCADHVAVWTRDVIAAIRELHGQLNPTKVVVPPLPFDEALAKEIEQKYGAKKLYEAGLSVQTGVDFTLQLAANRPAIHWQWHRTVQLRPQAAH